MACHCSGCQKSKQISTLRQLQSESEHQRTKPVGSKSYPSKSNKVYKDRYLAARKWLIWLIQHYKDGWEYRKKHPEKPGQRYTYWGGERLSRTSWGVKKYREARAECKKRGLL